MSDRKFNRAFILKAETKTSDEYLEIRSPYTIEFVITRNNLSKSNEATFTIYNLGSVNRAKLIKDSQDYNLEANRRAIQFFAGYAESQTELIPRCFNGTIRRAYSVRQGSDYRTVIEAYDGMPSFSTQMMSGNISLGQTSKDAIKKMAKQLDGVDKVTVGNSFTEVAKRYTAILGSPQDVFNEMSNGKTYIDDGSLYALGTGEVVDSEIRLINYENGLLGTPKRADLTVEIEMIFESRIRPMQLIELQSVTENGFSGVYQVTGIIHRGTISGAVGGDCRTVLTMMQQKGMTVVVDVATGEYRAGVPTP
jgi:hypothetical protein